MCPSHMWGSEFDFNEFYKAEAWIGKFYYRLTGKWPLTKEKYGTLRLEFECMWMETGEEVKLFCEILYRACRKWPQFSAELTNDAIVSFDNVPFYSAWFKGVNWGQCHSEWRGSKKPRHYKD